jgi:hypothetical protein
MVAKNVEITDGHFGRIMKGEGEIGVQVGRQILKTRYVI